MCGPLSARRGRGERPGGARGQVQTVPGAGHQTLGEVQGVSLAHTVSDGVSISNSGPCVVSSLRKTWIAFARFYVKLSGPCSIQFLTCVDKGKAPSGLTNVISIVYIVLIN